MIVEKRHTMSFLEISALVSLDIFMAQATFASTKNCFFNCSYRLTQLFANSMNVPETPFSLFSEKGHLIAQHCVPWRESNDNNKKCVLLTSKSIVISMKALAIFKCPTVSWYVEIRKSSSFEMRDEFLWTLTIRDFNSNRKI